MGYRKIGHPILGSESLDGMSYNDRDKKIGDYMASPEFTPEQYSNFVSGQYGHSSYDLPDQIKNHPHNTPQNNQKALKDLISGYDSQNEETDRGHGSNYSRKALIENILKNHALPEKTLKDVISNPDKYGDTSGAVSNPGITPSVIQHAMDTSKDVTGYLAHEKLAPELKDRFFKENDRITDKQAEALASRNDLSQDQVKKLLSSSGPRALGMRRYDNLLGQLPEDERKEHVSKIIGLSGGEKLDADGEDWNNWKYGDDYNERDSRYLAEHSEHLAPEHQEFLKRHGDTSEKIAMFENPKIDPKHYGEMWEKWNDDDSHHGYEQDEFKDHLKEKHEDSKWDDFSDEAREEAESDYPIEDYIRDNNIDLVEPEAVHEHMLENHDWHGENPDHDKKLAQGMEDLESVKDDKGEITGEAFNKWSHPHKEKVADYLNSEHRFDPSDPEDKVDYDSAKEEHDNDHNPAEVDYTDHRHLSMEEHPDYEDNYEKSKDKLEDEVRNNGYPDGVYDGHNDSLNDAISDKVSEKYDDAADDFMHDPDRLPRHVQGHIPQIEEAKAEERRQKEEKARVEAEEKEKELKGSLDKYIPNRKQEHLYGDNLHHLEMLKDHADANGGKIDVGSMNKLYPNLKDKWKDAFGDKGKMSSDDVQQKIDQTPKTKYNISHGLWRSNDMQNTNKQNEIVVRLDHSPESQAPLRSDKDLSETFDKVQDMSQRSGHPTNLNTIAWARVDANDPKHWLVDELQSDFGSTVRDYLDNNNLKEKGDLVGKIEEHHKNWRENLLNHVIKLAKAHGVEKISTHSPESKAAHTGSDVVHSVYKDSYQKIPRQMGFKPDAADNLPLSEYGKSVFTKEGEKVPTAEKMENHIAAMNQHMQMAGVHSAVLMGHPKDQQELIPSGVDPEKHEKVMDEHMRLAKDHAKKVKEMDPTHEIRHFTPKQGLRFVSGDEPVRHSQEDLISEKSSAIKEAKEGKVAPHPYDQALMKKPGEGLHPAHTLELRPAMLKKSIEAAEGEAEDLLFKTHFSLWNLRARISMLE